MHFIVLFLLVLSCQTPPQGKKSALFKMGDDLNQYRESLAVNTRAFKTIDENVFKVTCMPVGKRIKKIKQTKNITIKQISHKNRNPSNIVPEGLKSYYAEFLNNPQLNHLLVTYEGKELAMVRISVRIDCLVCHGHQSQLPDFIKKNYPQDKAHSFKDGDLRGVYLIQKD